MQHRQAEETQQPQGDKDKRDPRFIKHPQPDCSAPKSDQCYQSEHFPPGQLRKLPGDAADAERPASPTPRQWCPPCNRDVIAGFGAAGLFGDVILIISRHQEAPSAAPEGQGESSPGQKSPANAALGNRPLPTSPSFHGPPRQPAGWRGGPWKEGIFITSLPRTALRLSGATLMSSLRDFGLARCARKCRGTTQRPGPRDASIGTVARWPGSLQRMGYSRVSLRVHLFFAR